MNGTKAPLPIAFPLIGYLAEVSRARSHASHHIFMSSKGTTAQNRYGTGTSN